MASSEEWRRRRNGEDRRVVWIAELLSLLYFQKRVNWRHKLRLRYFVSRQKKCYDATELNLSRKNINLTSIVVRRASVALSPSSAFSAQPYWSHPGFLSDKVSFALNLS